MKILAFAGSSSSKSINQQLVSYALSLIPEAWVDRPNLADYELPLYSEDRQAAEGIPPRALDFARKISEADLILLSLAEHNASYSAVFKNLYDWISVIPDRTVWENKPMLLMATSPGARGGKNVLEAAKSRFPRNGAQILGTFSLPSFDDNFDRESNRISHEALDLELQGLVAEVVEQVRPARSRRIMLEVGEQLPEWDLKPIWDEAVPTLKSFQGKPLLILFYSMTCPGCVGRALPFANRIVLERRENLNLVGIHTHFEGPGLSQERLRETRDQYHIRFPYFQDAGQAITFQRFKASGTPHWILLDENGVVQMSMFGSDPNRGLLRLDLMLDEVLGKVEE